MNISETAARALLTRSRSTKELFDYLKRKGFDQEDIEEAINELIEFGYLSDERFCQEYMRYAFRKKWGKLRVFRELKAKGVSSEIIENAYEDFLYQNEVCENEEEQDRLFDDRIETDEYERAKAAAQKVIGYNEEITDKLIGRAARRLSGYGYSSDVIYRVIGDLKNGI